MQHQLIERGTALGHDEETKRWPPCCERLFHGTTSGDDLLTLREDLGR
jgi:hypothetical protein